MKIGEKLRELRLLRNLTMKELGVAAGFPEKSADVRISQYEANSRIPKADIIEKLAFALQVHPKFLTASNQELQEDIMHLLLSLDAQNTIRFHEEEYTSIHGELQLETFITETSLQKLFEEWYNIKKALQRGEISPAQYDEWRMNWPNKIDWNNQK